MSRSPRPFLAALVLAALVGTAACNAEAPAEEPPPAAGTSPTAAATTDGGTLPDVCTLLSKDEVGTLTGESISQVDTDGTPEASTRYCQWQLSNGQLAVALSRQTSDGLKAEHPEGKDVTGLGDEALADSGHLYVLANDVQVDVYARGGDTDDANFLVASKTAEMLIPRLKN